MNTRQMNAMRRQALPRAVAAAIAAIAAGTAAAEEWQWSVTPYLWATDLEVDVTLSDRDLIDADIPFDDLVDTLESGMFVRAEGMLGRHGMAFDLFNVELAESHGIEFPALPGSQLALDTEVGMTILDLAGVYNPSGDRTGFSLLYGARTIEQRNDFELALNFGGTNVGTQSFSATDTLVDGLVGMRYSRSLSPKLTYGFAADVSTGGTELTWSAGPALGYSFGENNRYRLTGGYRKMVVDFDTAESIDADLTMSGLLLAIRIDL